MTISLEVAAAMLNSLTAQLDAGVDAGYIEICSGSQPLSTNETSEDSDVLAIVVLNDPAFYLADINLERGWAQTDAVTTPALVDANCRASGNASWFRAYDSNGRPIIDGSVGSVEADILVFNAHIEEDQPFTISSWQLRLTS